MKIAFFDFDGTMTERDSLFVFLKFLVGSKKFYWGMLHNIHYLLGYGIGYLSNAEAKERVVAYFLRGIREEVLLERCKELVPYLEEILKTEATKRMQWHLEQGDQVVIVSATFLCYLAPLVQKLKVECIATELESKNGVLTGKFKTPNCYGREKVKRIVEKYSLDKYEEIYVYGDSRGDKEMLEIATKRFYRYF